MSKSRDSYTAQWRSPCYIHSLVVPSSCFQIFYYEENTRALFKGFDVFSGLAVPSRPLSQARNMPITFGSVGDIISVSLLVKDLLIALNDSRGSSAEYQAVVRELYILDTALLQVEQLSRSRSTTPELHALYETAKQTVAKCRDSVTAFRVRVRKYDKSLSVGGSGNVLRDTARKIQWRASQKDTDIAKFRAEVTGYADSINMLLATGMIKLINVQSTDLKDQLVEDGRRTHAAIDIHTQALKEVQTRLDNNRELILAGHSLASRMADRLEWIQKLGSDLKRFMCSIIAGNIAIYREVVALRSTFSKHVDRPLIEDPFILEDAIGRIAPVHLRFINSWAAFQAVMEIRFQGKQGLRKICQKEYVLQESATGREIDLSLDFEDAFLPGQMITMSLVFKRDSTEQSMQSSAHCPRCNTLSEQPTDVDVLCPTCHMWFRRITQIHEVDLPHPTARDTKVRFGEASFGRVQFGPKPLKRKLEEVDGEDGDYSRFKRIRVVSKARRVKAPRIFTGTKQTSAFHTPSENANNRPGIFKVNISGSAVDNEVEVTKETRFHGLVETDTFEYARSKYNSADDSWYKRPTIHLGPSYSGVSSPSNPSINAEPINEILPENDARPKHNSVHDDWRKYPLIHLGPSYSGVSSPSNSSINAEPINEMLPRNEASSKPVAPGIGRESAPLSPKETPKATEEDARRAGIPAGYCYKSWDPTEEPIFLLRRVFDAHSLGQRIYDWTAYHCGPTSPEADMADELWLLLIQLASKIKTANKTMPKICNKENQKIVKDFLESGKRLWVRFDLLLEVCEEYMWRAVKKERIREKPFRIGKNSNRKLVDTMFGRDREFEYTEELMKGMRLWSTSFDADCADILRNPSV